MTAGRTDLYGLIGYPVTHSLSPFIMNQAFGRYEMDAVYVGFGVAPSLLAHAVDGLVASGASGLNVTYPFKEEILYHLDAISTDAEIIQAVNTLIIDRDEVRGYNTDAPGTATALEVFADMPLDRSRVFVFGAGGSARAAAYGLLESGASRVTFAARSEQKAQLVVDRYTYAFPDQFVDFVLIGERASDGPRREAFAEANIVINATPVGMMGPATALIDAPELIQPGQVFFDFVYHPKDTEFLQTARAGGARTLGGLALLVSQAMESFRLWTGEIFDIVQMMDALDAFSNSDWRELGGVN